MLAARRLPLKGRHELLRTATLPGLRGAGKGETQVLLAMRRSAARLGAAARGDARRNGPVSGFGEAFCRVWARQPGLCGRVSARDDIGPGVRVHGVVFDL